MSSRALKQFDKQLASLLKARVYELKALVWPNPGNPPHLTPPKIKKAIRNMQASATLTLLKAKQSRRMFDGYDDKRQWHAKRGKPRGIKEKKTAFKRWYEKKITTKNCVYILWHKSKCRYVGRTINGRHRPPAHFSKPWFRNVTRIDIYKFDRKRDVPRFECMRTHRHEPTESKINPARRKYYSRCPICEAKRAIRADIKELFRLK